MLQVRNGDIRKLGLLFERHHRRLYNFFLRMTANREASQDLVQDVFFRMLKYRHTYQGKSKFTVWMFQIARNARVDYFKKRKEVVANEAQSEQMHPDPIVTEQMEMQEDVVLLHTAFTKLAVKDREVLELSRFQNLKYHEISDIMGCAVGTVKARVHYAIKNLRDIFFELSGEKTE